MAEDIRSMRIELSMKDMGIQRTVGQINKSFRALKSEVSTSSKKLQYGEKSVASYEKNVKDLTLAHKASRQNLKELTRQYHEVGKAQGYSSSQALGLQKSISDQEREMHFLGRQIVNTTNEMNEFKTAQKVDNTSWAKMGKGFEGMSTKIRGVSTQMAEIGSTLTSKITKPALIAGAAMGGITAKLGFDRLVGLDTAKAKLEGLGYSTKEVGSITGQVTNAIKGGMTTMAEGTDVAAGALAAGVKEGKELEHYIKLVGDAAVGSNRPVSEMAMIFNRVQGQGKLMTQELNMVEEGMPGFSNAMAKHLGVSYDAFREMVTAGEVSAKDFTTVMDDFAGGMAGAYSKSWQGMVQNTKAYVGMIGESLLSGVFEQAKGSLHEFEKLLQSDGAQKWATQTGVKLANAFTVIANGISGVVKWWNGLGSTTQSVLGGIIKWSALTLVAVGPLLSIFSKIGFVVAGVFGPFGKFLGIMGKVAVASKSAGGIIAGITTLFPKLGMALTLATGPVGLTIAAIVALGAAFVIAYKKSETFRNIVNDAISGVVAGFKILWSGVMTVLTPIGNAIAKFGRELAKTFGQFWAENGPQFMEALNNIKTGFMAVWSFLKPIFSGIGSLFKSVFGGILSFVQFMMPAIQVLFKAGWAIIKYIFVSTWEAIKGVVNGGLNIIMGVIKVFSGIFTGDFRKMWEGVKQIFFGAFQFIWNLVQLWFVGKIFGVFKLGFKLIKSIVSGSLGSVKGTFGSVLSSIWEIVKKIFTSIWNFIKMIFTNIAKFTRSVWNNIKLLVTNPVRGIYNIVTAQFRLLSKIVRTIFSALSKVIGAIWRGIRNTVVAIAKALYNTVRNRFQLLKDIVSKITRALGNALKATWNWIKNTIVGLVRGLYNTAKSVFTAMSKVLRSITSTLSKVVKSIWNGLKNAVVGTIRALFNTAKNIFNSIRKTLTNITQSLKNAVTGKWKDLKKSVIDLATGAKNGVVNGFKAMYNKGVEWLDKLKGFIKNAKDGFKKVASDLGKGVANGAISGLNAMIDGINTLSDKIMKKKLIKNKIKPLSTGTAASPGVQTNSQGQLTKSTKALVNDKGLGNARGPGGHKEIIQRRNGSLQQVKGRNKVVRLKRGDAVHNGMQSKALRPHLSTGTNPVNDLLKRKQKKHKGETDGSIEGLGGGAKDAVKALGGSIEAGANGAKDWAVDKGAKVTKGVADLGKAFGEKVGDVMKYVKNPMKLVDMTMKHFGVNFDSVKGAMGGTMDFGYSGLKNGLKSLIADWFAELEGGDGDGDASWLLKHPMLQEFGFYKGMTMNGTNRHWGLDFGMPTGTSVKAVTAGTVTDASFSPYGGGNQVTLEEPGGKWWQWWMHNSKFSFKKGDKVKPGDELAKSGNTGSSNTPHVHFQRMKGGLGNDKAVNPLQWLKSLGSSGAGGKYGSTIKKALGMAGLPQTSQYIKAWQEQARTESTFNPKARNPSGASGLVQVKPGTFGQYKLPGHGDIWNPLDNLIAGMRYAKATYGPKKMLNRIGHGLPYKTGGIINQNGMYNLAEDGHSEVVVPLDPARASDAMKLITYAQSKIKDKKNKRPNQVPTPSTGSNNTGSDNTNLLMQMIGELQEQNGYLKEIVRSNKSIEGQPKGFTERDVSQAQGKKAQMMAYNMGGAF
ncbi:peptidoglycan DD-metalloendopeptidase family protein [Staphylococcus equorum]|uniref:peptidoglycan DD-metalloendopeptidase family protein n=1 Tax=Staphylococcus equorum TaxID=246432 RepID=UPI00240820F1|nr:peptidoglycan DD-metalloendopeptidase family protein [Staphylococcus equorum]MDG0821329.1 peptidoglycan DD-metalloendopeptidase family protein [Staphylococcus equorum]